MDETLIFLEEYQTWIYLFLGLIGLLYLRLTLLGIRDLRNAFFGLERERAAGSVTRSASVLALVVAAGLATFVVATFAAPTVPASSRPTPAPTVSLLATPQADSPAEGETFQTATPFSLEEVDTSGCDNPEATIGSPTDGETVGGVIEIQGTADIANFAFYKYEFRSISSGAGWRAIGAGTAPIRDGILGTWDTNLVPADNYVVRLVVTDTQGNAPFPCTIQLRVAPGP